MQQSSATLKNQDVGIGLQKIVASSQPCLQCLLVATFFDTVSSLHPTSFLMIFILMYSHVDTGIHIILGRIRTTVYVYVQWSRPNSRARVERMHGDVYTRIYACYSTVHSHGARRSALYYSVVHIICAYINHRTPQIIGRHQSIGPRYKSYLRVYISGSCRRRAHYRLPRATRRSFYSRRARGVFSRLYEVPIHRYSTYMCLAANPGE